MMKTDSDLRNSLRWELTAELRKDADAIHPEYIDNHIDKLCILDEIHPPALSGEQIDAAISKIKIHFARNLTTILLNPLCPVLQVLEDPSAN